MPTREKLLGSPHFSVLQVTTSWVGGLGARLQIQVNTYMCTLKHLLLHNQWCAHLETIEIAGTYIHLLVKAKVLVMVQCIPNTNWPLLLWRWISPKLN